MKTLIEILDYEQTENIICPLVFDFDRIIYLYDKNHDHVKKRRLLEHLLNLKGLNHVQFLEVGENSESIFQKLSLNNPDAVFNLSNGSRTLLVKMARYCEKTNQRCFTLNFQRKTFNNLQGCEELQKQFKVPHLSIENIVELSGGEILKSAHTLPEMNTEMKADMLTIIDIMNSNSNAWTKLLGQFAKLISEQDPDDCSIWMDWPIEKHLQKLLKELKQKQIVRFYEHGNRIRVVFKNRTLMKMFSDSGAWLEYQSYLECLDSGLFDDVRISTVVDWNKESDDRNDPTCEIDLVVVKNCIPAFVSCKMNKCTALDLYEVKLLSQKLGGTLGRAAVISKAPALKAGEPLYLKAMELGITLIGSNEIESGKIAELLLESLR